MRTAPDVNQPSTVAIREEDPQSPKKAQIYRYNQPSRGDAAGTHELEPGIYLIVSVGAVDVSGANIDVQALPLSSKDPVPDPKGFALESGASLESVKQFFAVGKDLSPPDE